MSRPPDSGERPHWSFTWLLRIQRHGTRDSPRGGLGTFQRLFPWIVLLILLAEIAVRYLLPH